MFVSCTEHENRSAKHAVFKGDGLRCEGGGGGGGLGDNKERYRWPINVTTKSFNKHMTTTAFLTQHKTKTAITIEISRQHLKISDNKTRES